MRAPSCHRLLAAGAALAALLAPRLARAAHTFDLAQHMPPHYAAVWMVNWFGVPGSDPQPGGVDPSYGNWKVDFPDCGVLSSPSSCAAFEDAGLQRDVASRRRPMAGLYSSSARTPESQRRVQLMLSSVRRPCDPGARLDAFIVQLDSLAYTSLHPQNKQVPTWDLAARALEGFLAEGDAAGLASAVTVGNDATTYWHFGGSVGLTAEAQREAALTADIAEMATIASKHPSATHVNGRPLLAFYVDSALVPAATWQVILDAARAMSGVDFYALATTLDGAFFAAFDALSPWVNLGLWSGATGATLHDRAVDYARQMHAKLLAALPTYPGRVMLGGAAPGFDDFTQNWGGCTPREIPREPAVLQGQMDYLAGLGDAGARVQGVVFDTWDDWTEGTEMEPDIGEGAAKLVQARQLLGALFGEPADPSGDQALAARWASFGQARSCCFLSGTCSDAGGPALDLACPADAGPSPSDASTVGDAAPGLDATVDAAPVDASLDALAASEAGGGEGATSGKSGGCGCRVASDGASPWPWGSLALGIPLVGRRRYRRPEALTACTPRPGCSRS